MPNSYGIVVEGDFDKAVFHKLIERIHGAAPPIYVRQCHGVSVLKKLFPILLRDLEHVHRGGPVERALIIRDADGRDPLALEAELRERMRGQVYGFRFGVGLCIINQKMETLLLADPDAINRVAELRAVLRRRVSRPRGSLEAIARAKELFIEILSNAGLQYTAEVCREIAGQADLGVIRRLCPSFERFCANVVEP